MGRLLLKKRLTILNKFKTFVPVDCDNITMSDILDVCKSLNKGYLVIKVFSKEPINQTIVPYSVYTCCSGNFCLYVMDAVDSLFDINITTIRHICIYTIPKPFNSTQNILQMIEQSPFCFIDDNYMEVFEFNIFLQAYETDIMSSWIK